MLFCLRVPGNEKGCGWLHDALQEQFFRGLLDHFGAHMLPAMQSGSRGFQTDTCLTSRLVF